MTTLNRFLHLLLMLLLSMVAAAQDDDDVWRKVDLKNVDYQKARNHLVRLYCYYRFTDDGITRVADREFKLYRVSEGICQIDVRYGKDEDDGADIIVARNLVHPEQSGRFMEFFELKPHTFLENARRKPKLFTIGTQGDTTRVFTRSELAGTVVRDTLARELRMHYNALAPDTSLSLNLLIVKAKLKNVEAKATYRLEDADDDYVPQGKLQHIVFEGDMTVTTPLKVRNSRSGAKGSIEEIFHELTEIYVDSVAYLTRDEYRASRKLSKKELSQQTGYDNADIDRLKQKLGVPPLHEAQLQRIEQQRDWDEAFELWKETKH